ncbi:hypothetical protein CWC16_20010, partial [Pseudoalteromonas sp. S3776]
DGQVTALSFAVDGVEVASSNGSATAHTWQAAQLGPVTFTLTVTDDKGATGEVSKTLTVIEAGQVNNRDACQPAGLYQTPGVNTPYCTIYDE